MKSGDVIGFRELANEEFAVGEQKQVGWDFVFPINSERYSTVHMSPL
jgi:hypothetical protein